MAQANTRDSPITQEKNEEFGRLDGFDPHRREPEM